MRAVVASAYGRGSSASDIECKVMRDERPGLGTGVGIVAGGGCCPRSGRSCKAGYPRMTQCDGRFTVYETAQAYS